MTTTAAAADLAAATTTAGDSIVTVDRRRAERRDPQAAADTAQPQRRKKQRRRQIDPTTCERDYSEHEIEFMQAMDAYKRAAGRMFPTCSEILEVIRSLGYVRLNEEQLALIQTEEFETSAEAFDFNADEDEDELEEAL
ncbi:hypothetical protein [Candidatus Laterigemmans baculatus]|uniref:hypothetical protein n=1 Tax=Candidatus Laterigemmans baculatus TaxID=2770505 RepID=UPI001F400AEE|nr:hypothetical protein [Candidatus Laterigemmans baculatus]